MKLPSKSHSCWPKAVVASLFSAAVPMSVNAAAVTLVGTGSGALVHNGTSKIDITDPNNDQVIDTAEWGTAPVVTTGTAGTFNGPGNNGENWAKVFDGAVNAGGPWGTGTSKVCCDFNPGTTSITMTSTVSQYSLSGYTISTGNDVPDRRPDGWRVFGSNDGFASENVLIDTVVQGDINGGAGWTSNNQVGEVVLAAPTAGFSSFRIIFDDSVSPIQFQVAEIELIGTAVPEPTTSTVGLLAALGLLIRRRRLA